MEAVAGCIFMTNRLKFNFSLRLITKYISTITVAACVLHHHVLNSSSGWQGNISNQENALMFMCQYVFFYFRM